MKITAVDRNPLMVPAAQAVGLDAACGSITEFPCDAVVSPANSFGFMDGGVDYAYSVHFGWHVQDRVKEAIAALPFGELLVGQALIVPTDAQMIPWLISAPTMRVPRIISDANDLRLATRAAVKAALDAGLSHIAFPGMGTGCGRVPFDVAAKAMSLGIEQALRGAPVPKTWQEAQSRHFGLVL